MKNSPTQNTAAVPDGRRLRSERSRQAIIDAMLGLVDEGNLLPTAQQVADKAEVGIRTVFRHFSDMESLYVSADAQSRDDYEALFVGGNREGTLEERILHAVERHANGYEKSKNTILSAQAQLWRYEVLRKNYARYQRGLRKDLDGWLPELKSVSASEREAVDALASFEMWHRLRYHQGLSKKQSTGIVVDLLSRLVAAG
jgi:AcrR family transcriptional regulator